MRWRRDRPLLLGATGPRYRTTLDRIGLALGAGAVAGGAVTALASGPEPLAVLVAFAGGAVLTLLAAVLLGGPLWWLAGLADRRGPVSAAATGAVAGFALFLGVQAAGFAGAGIDALTLPYRWASAVAIALLLAGVAAAVALVAWRVAYRRVR
ncbi:hypothetical protein [Sphingomonas immobilis]|uniref:Uncharacterized protein n=1 Tax=Sphingomonas immobilis TaxID=3063997 RepID=A0ABT9A2H0_9SPHN|nr:hypothetical protein [Sphingomonas sp. CA1-15]MDO7844028.1 hypothetical protein [Sphingomonas sp. CA1-15]